MARAIDEWSEIRYVVAFMDKSFTAFQKDGIQNEAIIKQLKKVYDVMETACRDADTINTLMVICKCFKIYIELPTTTSSLEINYHFVIEVFLNFFRFEQKFIYGGVFAKKILYDSAVIWSKDNIALLTHQRYSIVPDTLFAGHFKDVDSCCTFKNGICLNFLLLTFAAITTGDVYKLKTSESVIKVLLHSLENIDFIGSRNDLNIYILGLSEIFDKLCTCFSLRTGIRNETIKLRPSRYLRMTDLILNIHSRISIRLQMEDFDKQEDIKHSVNNHLNTLKKIIDHFGHSLNLPGLSLALLNTIIESLELARLMDERLKDTGPFTKINEMLQVFIKDNEFILSPESIGNLMRTFLRGRMIEFENSVNIIKIILESEFGLPLRLLDNAPVEFMDSTTGRIMESPVLMEFEKFKPRKVVDASTFIIHWLLKYQKHPNWNDIEDVHVDTLPKLAEDIRNWRILNLDAN